jgi:hypothetical protein
VDEVAKILSSPAIKAGLKVVAPEIGLGLDLAVTIVSGIFKARHKPKIEELLAVMDRQLAKLIGELAVTKSRPRQQELEVRIHALLGVILEWDKLK